MIQVQDVVRCLDQIAPPAGAESWDNVGLVWGDPSAAVERIMICLTVSTTTAREAVREQVQLIVSHHPVLFRQTRRVRADLADCGFLWLLARAGISVASPHTAWDNAPGGINDLLCEKLGVAVEGPLRPRESTLTAPQRYKITVFTPQEDHERVLGAAFAAGAGHIGAYQECSFAIPGQGTFFGDETTHPTVGERGRRETAAELRVEFVCPASRLTQVLAAVRQAHSYEEPAIDVFPLAEPPANPPAGSGRIGRLVSPCSLADFANKTAEVLNSRCVQYVGEPARPIERVAVACGAGDDFLPDAHSQGADVLLTGEARFHRGIETLERGLTLLTAGHHATERPGVEHLANRLRHALPDIPTFASRDEFNPFLTPET